MSEEQLKAFLEKVKADTSLQDKLNAAGSNEAAIEIAKAAGFAITADDIKTQPVELQTRNSRVQLVDEQLSDGRVEEDVCGSLIKCNFFTL